jgi:hypothetical protein
VPIFNTGTLQLFVYSKSVNSLTIEVHQKQNFPTSLSNLKKMHNSVNFEPNLMPILLKCQEKFE